MIGVVAALAAALAWTVASGMWRSLPTSLNSLQLNGLKNAIATLVFVPVLIALPWLEQWHSIGLLLISGFIGIAIGDTFYLSALRRLGTRRTLTIEAISPLLAGIGSAVLMGEPQSSQAWIGAFLVSISVVMVARQAPPRKGNIANNTAMSQRLGIIFSLAAVICGLSGAFLSRLVLKQGELMPLDTSAVRLLGGLLLLTPLLMSFPISFTGPHPAQKRWHKVIMATLLGTNLGILLTQVVFRLLPVGQGVTMLSTAPVMALALSRQEGDRPRLAGILSSLFSVIGVALAVTG